MGTIVILTNVISEIFKQASNEIFKITKSHPPYIRPPYFNVLTALPELFSKKYYVVGGDVIAYDWKTNSNGIFYNVVNKVKNGSVIVFHDGSEDENEKKRCKEMIKVLPKIIEILKKKYDLVRLDKMKF